jgi:hypothetical protein
MLINVLLADILGYVLGHCKLNKVLDNDFECHSLPTIARIKFIIQLLHNMEMKERMIGRYNLL